MRMHPVTAVLIKIPSPNVGRDREGGARRPSAPAQPPPSSGRSLFFGKHAQSTIEFTFSMIVTVLLIVGMIKVFVWSGSELVQRTQQHERVLTQECTDATTCAYRQLQPDFFAGADIDAAVPGNIYR